MPFATRSTKEKTNGVLAINVPKLSRRDKILVTLVVRTTLQGIFFILITIDRRAYFITLTTCIFVLSRSREPFLHSGILTCGVVNQIE